LCVAIYNNGAVTIPSGEALWMWITHLTPGSVDPEVGAPGGLQVLIGDAAGAYKCWDSRGGDTMLYGADWICEVIDPTITADDTVGSPSSTTSFFGVRATLTGGPTKGAPLAIDAFRFGRNFNVSVGDASTPATFAGIASWNDNINRRYGQFQLKDGAYLMQGRLALGLSATAVYFDDSNRAIFIRRNEKIPAAFNEIDIVNASSTVNWKNINITALGTVSKGTFVMTDNATVSLDTCVFTDMAAFTFQSNATCTDTTFRRTGIITQGGATFTDCTFDGSTNTHHILATNPGLISGCNFIFGSGHAVRCDTIGTYAWDGNTDTGYTGTRGSNGTPSSGSTDAMFYNNSGGLITLAVGAGGQAPSVRNGAGATTVVTNAVTIKITVVTAGGTPIVGARVEVSAEETVGTITTGDVLLTGITDGSGIIQDTTFDYESAFDPSGLDISFKVRKATGTPLYKAITRSGTIESGTGFVTIAQLQLDQ